MFEENGNQILKVEEVQTSSQTAIVKTFYDMKYHTKLTYLNGQVTAEVYNYRGQLQTDYADPITLDLDGEQIAVTPVNGAATIDFSSTATGEFIIKTIDSVFRNGEVKIYV